MEIHINNSTPASGVIIVKNGDLSYLEIWMIIGASFWTFGLFDRIAGVSKNPSDIAVFSLICSLIPLIAAFAILRIFAGYQASQKIRNSALLYSTAIIVVVAGRFILSYFQN